MIEVMRLINERNSGTYVADLDTGQQASAAFAVDKNLLKIWTDNRGKRRISLTREGRGYLAGFQAAEDIARLEALR